MAQLADAQNWALLNPAYKYNYSNDGSDTISNQIFVTHIDTLGPDSFRYELNRIGVQCDTCPASMGSTCDGCFIRTNQPQFLGLDAHTDPNSWRCVFAANELEIQPASGLGTTWLFDPASMTMATVSAIDTGTVLGVLDSLKTISLSNNDSIILSKDHGLVHFPSTGAGMMSFALIGIQTLGLGELIPDIHGMFGLQPGDVVEYSSGWGAWIWPYQEGAGYTVKRSILTRTEFVDYVSFTWSGVYQEGSSTYNYATQVETHSAISHPAVGVWEVPLEMEPAFHEMASSYPHQVVRSNIDWGLLPGVLGFVGASALCIAEHGRDSTGRYFMQGQVFQSPDPYEPYCLFAPWDSVDVGLYAHYNSFSTAENYVWVKYLEGIGLITCQEPMFESAGEIHLVGAVINGDTIGTVHSDSYLLGVLDSTRPVGAVLHPNPATDQVQLDPAPKACEWLVLDHAGRVVLRGTLAPNETRISTATLAPGSYVLTLVSQAGKESARFVIAR